MIILDHVSKHYQTRDNKDFVAVEPTSLEIKQGEIFGLMGYSGAGKSTLLRLINLLERPDTGTVRVCGQELTALNATQLRHARQNIGMVFQQFNLLSNRTVSENVAFPLEIAKWPSKKIQARVEECLEIVDLQDRANHYPSQLSGGQKQRVGIARARHDVCGIAAAHYGRGVAICDRVRYMQAATSEFIDLKNPHRSVPPDRLCIV